MDRFIEEHPILTFALFIAVIVIGVCIKTKIDEKKGKNSPEKHRIRKILSDTIVDCEGYIPVYGYHRKLYGRNSVTSWHYAMGINSDKLYVIPLILGETEIGYTKVSVIRFNDLGRIDCGKPGGPIHYLKFYDKSEKIIFEVTVEEKNTKMDKSYPFNITQVDETRAFMSRLEQCCKLQEDTVKDSVKQ